VTEAQHGTDAVKHDEVTKEGVDALARKLEAMKATGTYDKWRQGLREQADAYERSPRGRFESWLRNIRFTLDRLLGRL
jgi:hypothetical protein